jgi:hypothetical protein
MRLPIQALTGCMGDEETELTIAARHVKHARQKIAQQQVRISRLRALGYPTTDAELTLDVFLGSLKVLQEHSPTASWPTRMWLDVRTSSPVPTVAWEAVCIRRSPGRNCAHWRRARGWLAKASGLENR